MSEQASNVQSLITLETKHDENKQIASKYSVIQPTTFHTAKSCHLASAALFLNSDFLQGIGNLNIVPWCRILKVQRGNSQTKINSEP